MDYIQSVNELAKAQYQGQAAREVAAKPPLAEIRDTIHETRAYIGQIAMQLCQHADAVFYPEGDATSNAKEARPSRGGQLGEVQDALDDLNKAVTVLAHQADRNCSLA